MRVRRSPLQWASTIGGALALLVPKGLCPICVAAGGSLLSAVGLGGLARDAVVRWALPVLLVLGLIGLIVAARRHGRRWVVALGAAGSIALYVSWLLGVRPALHASMAVLAAASAASFWAMRNPARGPGRPGGPCVHRGPASS
jgi:hypothetical protein